MKGAKSCVFCDQNANPKFDMVGGGGGGEGEWQILHLQTTNKALFTFNVLPGVRRYIMLLRQVLAWYQSLT